MRPQTPARRPAVTATPRHSAASVSTRSLDPLPARALARRPSARGGALLGAALLAVGLLSGCTEEATPHRAATTCASGAPNAVVASAALRAGRADPAPHRVEVPLDGQVQVQVTADQEAEIHVHGYDFAFPVTPDRPGCISFFADRSGLFDVEAHPDTLLVQLEVR